MPSPAKYNIHEDTEAIWDVLQLWLGQTWRKQRKSATSWMKTAREIDSNLVNPPDQTSQLARDLLARQSSPSLEKLRDYLPPPLTNRSKLEDLHNFVDDVYGYFSDDTVRCRNRSAVRTAISVMRGAIKAAREMRELPQNSSQDWDEWLEIHKAQWAEYVHLVCGRDDETGEELLETVIIECAPPYAKLLGIHAVLNDIHQSGLEESSRLVVLEHSKVVVAIARISTIDEIVLVHSIAVSPEIATNDTIAAMEASGEWDSKTITSDKAAHERHDGTALMYWLVRSLPRNDTLKLLAPSKKLRRMFKARWHFATQSLGPDEARVPAKDVFDEDGRKGNYLELTAEGKQAFLDKYEEYADAFLPTCTVKWTPWVPSIKEE